MLGVLEGVFEGISEGVLNKSTHCCDMFYFDGSDDVGVDEGSEIDGEDEGRGVVGDFVGPSAQNTQKMKPCLK